MSRRCALRLLDGLTPKPLGALRRCAQVCYKPEHA